MKIHLIAVGRAKRGPEMDLLKLYEKRMRWTFTLTEVEEKKRITGDELKMAEAKLLENAIPDGAKLIALDERGKDIKSQDFARKLEDWQGMGFGTVAFIIGGADGLAPHLRQRADFVLSFGKLTWPHMMVRAMLAEQVYRAQQIIAGHPYHRE